jgi:hypothetical protein
MALNACPFHRHPVPIKCPPHPPPVPSFPQTREYTRAPRSLVRIHHCRRHNLFEFGRHREVSPLVSGPYSSPRSSAPSDVLCFSYFIANRRLRLHPKLAVARACSGRTSLTHRKALDVVDLSIAFVTSAWTSSCLRRRPEANRAPAASAPESHAGDKHQNPSSGKTYPLPFLLLH